VEALRSDSKLRLFLVEDQPLFRELLSSFLSTVPEFEIVGSSGTVEEAKLAIQAASPDLVVLDIDLPDGNGVGLAATLRRRDSSLGIVLLSDKDLLELVRTLPKDIQRGISYLAKSSAIDLELLISAIKSTAKGYSVIDPRLSLRAEARPGTGIASLNKRQFEVLRLLAAAKSTEAIASDLGLAQNSVVNILTSIYNQLNIPEDANARVYAVLQFLSDTTDEIR
jgi:DNA-binding NarL/FixJ family response regulator